MLIIMFACFYRKEDRKQVQGGNGWKVIETDNHNYVHVCLGSLIPECLALCFCASIIHRYRNNFMSMESITSTTSSVSDFTPVWGLLTCTGTTWTIVVMEILKWDTISSSPFYQYRFMLWFSIQSCNSSIMVNLPVFFAKMILIPYQ